MRSSAPLPRAPWRLSRSARCSAGLTAPVLRGWRAPVLRQRASSSLTPLTRDRGAAVPLRVREQSLKTPERLLELSKRLSKVADDFEVRARVGWSRRRLLPASARPNASAPTAHLPRAPGLTTEPAGGPLRTPPHTPGAAYAAGAAGHRGEPTPAKPLPLPATGSDETTLSRFTSILSRLETVTDQVQELREKVACVCSPCASTRTVASVLSQFSPPSASAPSLPPPPPPRRPSPGNPALLRAAPRPLRAGRDRVMHGTAHERSCRSRSRGARWRQGPVNRRRAVVQTMGM